MLLIIDDNELLADMIGEMCDSIMDYKVITKYISLLSIPVEELDAIKIILTDWHLDPNRTADDVYEYIRLMGINCKICVMTGAIISSDILSKYDGVLYKPFTLQQVSDILRMNDL